MKKYIKIFWWWGAFTALWWIVTTIKVFGYPEYSASGTLFPISPRGVAAQIAITYGLAAYLIFSILLVAAAYLVYREKK